MKKKVIDLMEYSDEDFDGFLSNLMKIRREGKLESVCIYYEEEGNPLPRVFIHESDLSHLVFCLNFWQDYLNKYLRDMIEESYTKQ